MSNHGANFMFGTIDKKLDAKKTTKHQPDGIAVSRDEIDAVLSDVEGVGKKLHAGIKGADARLKSIGELGLTPELLVLLVTERAPYPRGSKHRLSPQQVEAALKGLYAIGEWIR